MIWIAILIFLFGFVIGVAVCGTTFIGMLAENKPKDSKWLNDIVQKRKDRLNAIK